MQLKSKIAQYLDDPKFELYFEGSYSSEIERILREQFPEKETDVKMFDNISVVTIKDKRGNPRQVLNWHEGQAPRELFMGETRHHERDVIYDMMKQIGLEAIGPARKDAIERLKEYHGIYDR